MDGGMPETLKIGLPLPRSLMGSVSCPPSRTCPVLSKSTCNWRLCLLKNTQTETGLSFLPGEDPSADVNHHGSRSLPALDPFLEEGMKCKLLWQACPLPAHLQARRICRKLRLFQRHASWDQAPSDGAKGFPAVSLACMSVGSSLLFLDGLPLGVQGSRSALFQDSATCHPFMAPRPCLPSVQSAASHTPLFPINA